MEYRTADEKFFAEARRRSPKFPDISEVLARRQRQRETIAARVLLFVTVVGLISTPFSENWSFDLIAAAFGFVGFVITCFVSGNRAWKRNGSLSNRGRPF